jgi:hypothetical protein
MKTVLVLAAALVAAPGIAQPVESTSAEAVPTASTEQAISPVESPAVATIAPAGDNVLRAGSTVSVRLLEELTTERKLARVGQRFRMEIAEPVMLNGKIVIPAGSPAQGEITSVRNKGMWGKSGHITARVLYATVGGRQIRLSGTFDDKGVTGTAGVVGSIALVPLAGFFVTGTSARINSGTVIGAYLDEDISILP